MNNSRWDSLDEKTKRQALLALDFLMQAPISMWACNQNYEIVLWNPGAEQIYGISEAEAIGTNYLELFVDEAERTASKFDCDKVIEGNWTQHNCLAEDTNRVGRKLYMLTNVFPVTDHAQKATLQAEVGVEISNLGEKQKEHRQLRELGIKKLVKARTDTEGRREVLLSHIERCRLTIRLAYTTRLRALEKWNAGPGRTAQVADRRIRTLKSDISHDNAILKSVEIEIHACGSLEEISQITRRLEEVEQRLRLYEGSL